ncbi:GNAT family N-acetyltransferase [Paraflavitalea pollutisoli]|uniref:GNAT family N-acetyltransferase n=1 Tax=Paraflavitalea pollutisoli TaxID=3034143 RepID=UPI0023EBDEDB|nr:GNAT family N-acetyltransferase [Paraflavitalea sp. H1-2-19X]
MDYNFRKAVSEDLDAIWEILQQAILRRKKDGSQQWQDGYPNPVVVQKDIDNGAGYVLITGDVIVGYCAILVNDEPAYAGIEGKWLTEGDFVVFHRVAIAEQQLGKGLAKVLFGFIEDYARTHGIMSIKADTNFDNPAMLNLFQKQGYVYCGEVYFRGSARKAFEKVLTA